MKNEGIFEAMYIDLTENSDMDDATVFMVMMVTIKCMEDA